MKQPCAYILASSYHGTLYTGVTSDLIKREKQIKKYRRTWKYNLIEKANPQWLDLYNQILGV